jgi:hypothetical protein
MSDQPKPASVKEIVARAIAQMPTGGMTTTEWQSTERIITRAVEEAVAAYVSKLQTILKERSKGEYHTWGFVAMFMEMIDEAMK